MKKFTKVLALALAAVICLGMLAACGKVEKDDTPASKVIDIDLTDELYAFGVDKDQPELLEKVNEFIAQIMEDGTFDEICNNYFGDGTPVAVEPVDRNDAKDQLVVATNAEFEPFEYKKGNKYYGIDMEIAAKLAEYLEVELVIENMKFDAVCLSVGNHQCDIAMAGLTVKPEREEMVTFSDTYYTASQKIIVPGDNTEFDDCKTAEDVIAILNEKDDSTKIGYQNGTTGQFFVQGDDDWGFEGFKVSSAGYSSGSLAVQDMIHGNVDYVIIDAAPAVCITEAINAVS